MSSSSSSPRAAVTQTSEKLRGRRRRGRRRKLDIEKATTTSTKTTTKTTTTTKTLPLLTCLPLYLHLVVLLVLCLFAALPDNDFRLIPLANAFFIDSRQSPPMHDWSYEQQLHWQKQYKTCRLKAQSPIDIQHKNVITNNQLKLNFYNYNRPTRFRLQNAHHTIKMDPLGWAYERSLDAAGSEKSQFQHATNQNNSLSVDHDMITADEYVEFTNGPLSSSSSSDNNEQLSKLLVSSSSSSAAANDAGNSVRRITTPANQKLPSSNDVERNDRSLPYEGAPTIKLDWLDDGNNEYKLRDIHFHWGERRDNGSEHAIDGRRAAMEMHLVHIKHGLDKSKIGFTSDSVTVIAVLIESHRKSNADFNPIVNVLSRINATEEPQEIDYKSINDLLPSNLNSFYTYSGSLTTPPCYQVVNWIVMTERLNMNAKQIEMFRNLYSSANHHAAAAAADDDDDHRRPELIVPNVRFLQPLNGRTILASFYKTGIGRLDSSLYSGSSASSISQLKYVGSNGLIIMLAYTLASLAFISAAISSSSVHCYNNNKHQRTRID